MFTPLFRPEMIRVKQCPLPLCATGDREMTDPKEPPVPAPEPKPEHEPKPTPEPAPLPEQPAEQTNPNPAA
jgi:hypothetical protein